jgi:hypothetical protein
MRAFVGCVMASGLPTLHCEVGRAMVYSGASRAFRALYAAFRQGCACAMWFVRITTKNTGQIDAAKWKITRCVGGNLNEL